MVDKKQNNEEAKGFAGLSSLLSDIDMTVLSPDKTETVRQGISPGNEPPVNAPPSQPKPNPNEHQSHVEPPQQGSGFSVYIWGAVILFILFWAIAQGEKQPSSSAPAYISPEQTTATRNLVTSQPQEPSRPDESKPPVGQNLVLTVAQIRYCLAEDIRMEGARAALNLNSDAHVEYFNELVGDYNRRCSNFRYRNGSLESAKNDIEPYRHELLAQGRNRFARGSSTDKQSAPATPRIVPDETVRAVQQKLNELGYNAGSADGQMGKDTRTASSSFQKESGLSSTGAIDQVLILKLQQASPRRAADKPSTYSSQSSNINPSVGSLSYDEKSAIDMACILKKSEGAASYNRCLNAQLRELANAPRKPDMSGLSYNEKSAIDMACILKKSEGAASYNRCLSAQLRELANAPREPDMSGLSYNEKSAIDMACILNKSDGAASYNRCLSAQLRELANAPREPDMSGLPYNEKSAIDMACILIKSEGAASYNRCLIAKLRQLGK